MYHRSFYTVKGISFEEGSREKRDSWRSGQRTRRMQHSWVDILTGRRQGMPVKGMRGQLPLLGRVVPLSNTSLAQGQTEDDSSLADRRTRSNASKK